MNPEELAREMANLGIIDYCAIDDPEGYDGGKTLQAIHELAMTLRVHRITELAHAIKPPNDSGSTQVIARWMVETPHGWVAAWDKEAIEWIMVRRPWVGLTDEEIENLSRLKVFANGTTYEPSFSAIVRAIEAKLRERNL